MQDHDEAVRLNKYIASCGITSRRGADDLISAGRVQVNGQTVDGPGLKIVPGQDSVSVDGKAVRQQQRDITLIIHKPVQTVTTMNDPQGRKTVLSLLPPDIRKLRPVPVGRLDFFSEGLLIMTTDGDLCHRLTHPRHHQPKVYEIIVRPAVTPEQIRQIEAGMTLAEGEKLAPVRVRTFNPRRDSQMLQLTLSQGVNRQIRRMCRDLDLTVLKLRRVRQGPVLLDKLKPGEWRELTGEELRDLRTSVGLG